MREALQAPSLVQSIVDQEGWRMKTVSNKHELGQSI